MSSVFKLCMAINISVQYNGGLLPDIIILAFVGGDAPPSEWRAAAEANRFRKP